MSGLGRRIARIVVFIVGSLALPAAADTPQPPLAIYPRVGEQRESDITPHGPGLMLMGGGGTVDDAVVWMHDVIAGDRMTRGGDIVVLRATGDDEYSIYFMKVARFNSVRTIVVGRDATTVDLERVASYIDRAQGVFFSGGDQGNYARWKGTPLAAAVQRVYERGGVVGGTSAGLAILGEYVYDAVAADAAGDDVEVTTSNAVADPSEPIISFTHDLLAFKPLRRVITDTHFVARNRFGRLAVFLARIRRDAPGPLLGVGIDERTAIVIDKHGIGTLELEHHGGSALFIKPTGLATIKPGQPFAVQGLEVTVLDRAGQRYDFNTWCAPAPSYRVDIDGRKSPIYQPSDPYRPPPGAQSAHC